MSSRLIDLFNLLTLVDAHRMLLVTYVHTPFPASIVTVSAMLIPHSPNSMHLILDDCFIFMLSFVTLFSTFCFMPFPSVINDVVVSVNRPLSYLLIHLIWPYLSLF